MGCSTPRFKPAPNKAGHGRIEALDQYLAQNVSMQLHELGKYLVRTELLRERACRPREPVVTVPVTYQRNAAIREIGKFIFLKNLHAVSRRNFGHESSRA